jgi:hypothetical protein
MYLLRTMNFHKLLWRVASFLFVASCAFALQQNRTGPAEALPPLPSNPNDYIRQVLQHELDAQKNDHTHWRYRFHKEDEKGSQDRDVIDAKEGQIARTLLINGQPLNAEQRANDDARMKKLVEDPGERAKRAKREKDDEDKLMMMFKAIPDAFNFKYDGEENGQVRLAFSPNPHYDAPTRELQVFKSLAGKMWTDRAAGRMARMEGTLFEDVTFGWGLLGRLNKGGTFTVVQNNVGQGHWDVVSLDVAMTGHAVVFKSINVKQKQRVTDFQRVSDSLTIAQAYKLLVNPESAVSAVSTPNAIQPPK